VYEGRMTKAIESAVASGGETIPLPMNEPWERILALSRVSRFIAAREDLPSSPSSEYATLFLGPLDAASSGLRTALDEQLTGRIRSRPGLGPPHRRSERAAPEGLPPTAATRIVDTPPTDRSTQRPDPVT